MHKGPAALALLALLLPIEANASSFGRCAQEGNLELKIAACTEASRPTPYPWVLRWVHRELARAHRERGEVELARGHYVRSLAAREDQMVRREMEELPHPPGTGRAGPAIVEGQIGIGHPASLADIGVLTVDSDFTAFMHKDVPEEVRRAALRKLRVPMQLPVSCGELCYGPEPAPSVARVADVPNQSAPTQNGSRREKR